MSEPTEGDEWKCDCGAQVVVHAGVSSCLVCDCADMNVGFEYGLCLHSPPCPPVTHDHEWVQSPTLDTAVCQTCGAVKPRVTGDSE